MWLAYSMNGVPIRLTKERLEHIARRHPEDEHRILETLNKRDLVQQGDAGTLLAVKKFDKSPVTENKHLAVVYRELQEDGFVLTAYYSSTLKQRTIKWKN